MVQSVLGAQTFDISDAFDAVIIIQRDFKVMKITVLTDSATLFNILIRNSGATEKRLMIDIKASREAYNVGIIDYIIWIRRKYNLADGMTKSAELPELFKSISDGKLYYEIEQSITRVNTEENDTGEEERKRSRV